MHYSKRISITYLNRIRLTKHFSLQVREARRGGEAVGPHEAEREHDVREVQPSHEVPLPAVGAGVRAHRASRLPVRPQGTRLQNRQPQLRESEVRKP